MIDRPQSAQNARAPFESQMRCRVPYCSLAVNWMVAGSAINEYLRMFKEGVGAQLLCLVAARLGDQHPSAVDRAYG